MLKSLGRVKMCFVACSIVTMLSWVAQAPVWGLATSVAQRNLDELKRTVNVPTAPFQVAVVGKPEKIKIDPSMTVDAIKKALGVTDGNGIVDAESKTADIKFDNKDSLLIMLAAASAKKGVQIIPQANLAQTLFGADMVIDLTSKPEEPKVAAPKPEAPKEAPKPAASSKPEVAKPAAPKPSVPQQPAINFDTVKDAITKANTDGNKIWILTVGPEQEPHPAYYRNVMPLLKVSFNAYMDALIGEANEIINNPVQRQNIKEIAAGVVERVFDVIAGIPGFTDAQVQSVLGVTQTTLDAARAAYKAKVVVVQPLDVPLPNPVVDPRGVVDQFNRQATEIIKLLGFESKANVLLAAFWSDAKNVYPKNMLGFWEFMNRQLAAQVKAADISAFLTQNTAQSQQLDAQLRAYLGTVLGLEYEDDDFTNLMTNFKKYLANPATGIRPDFFGLQRYENIILGRTASVKLLQDFMERNEFLLDSQFQKDVFAALAKTTLYNDKATQRVAYLRELMLVLVSKMKKAGKSETLQDFGAFVTELGLENYQQILTALGQTGSHAGSLMPLEVVVARQGEVSLLGDQSTLLTPTLLPQVTFDGTIPFAGQVRFDAAKQQVVPVVHNKIQSIEVRELVARYEIAKARMMNAAGIKGDNIERQMLEKSYGLKATDAANTQAYITALGRFNAEAYMEALKAYDKTSLQALKIALERYVDAQGLKDLAGVMKLSELQLPFDSKTLRDQLREGVEIKNENITLILAKQKLLVNIVDQVLKSIEKGTAANMLFIDNTTNKPTPLAEAIIQNSIIISA